LLRYSRGWSADETGGDGGAWLVAPHLRTRWATIADVLGTVLRRSFGSISHL